MGIACFSGDFGCWKMRIIADSAAARSIFARRTARTLAVVFLMTTIFAPLAKSVWAAADQTVVVRDDKGGAVNRRAALIEHYRSSGENIEIRGQYCLSACTLYLGLENTCIVEKTVFGFHGPSSRFYGVSLTPPAFEYWSAFMAKYYPEPIKTWFIETARHRTVGFYEIRGKDLIKMGITRCNS